MKLYFNLIIIDYLPNNIKQSDNIKTWLKYNTPLVLVWGYLVDMLSNMKIYHLIATCYFKLKMTKYLA